MKNAMWKNTMNGMRLLIYLLLVLIVFGACAFQNSNENCSEIQAFETFYRANGDSIAIVPRRVRAQAFQKWLM